MSAATAALHRTAELTFARADDVLNQVHYTSVSASGANGATNHTALDVITGEVLCSCKGAECGRACWHADLIAAARAAHPAVALARQYTTEQLVKAGTKAARMCRVYRARAWRVLPADAVAVVACRQEYRRRMGRAVATAEAAA